MSTAWGVADPKYSYLQRVAPRSPSSVRVQSILVYCTWRLSCPIGGRLGHLCCCSAGVAECCDRLQSDLMRSTRLEPQVSQRARVRCGGNCRSRVETSPVAALAHQSLSRREQQCAQIRNMRRRRRGEERRRRQLLAPSSRNQ